MPDSTEAEGADSSLRSDAIATRARILAAAAVILTDRRVSMVQIAAAAKVSRSTLYRHFTERREIVEAIEAERAHLTDPAGGSPAAFREPGSLGTDRGLGLEVTRILDEVPPHLIADQLVSEARRAAGGAVAIYVVDIDGSQLVRLAGSEDFPATLEAPPALGPEIVPEGLPAFYTRLREVLPRCVATPLFLRGRVLGLLLTVGHPVGTLADVAKQGAAALELARDYTDVIERARRSKPTTASAEVQQGLLPPRIARVTGAQIAGGLLPSYEVGGDWFDYVENRDGTWLAIAEASGGSGPTAAGLGAATLGALRAARRCGQDLVEAVETMDGVVRELGNPAFTVTAILARWHAPTGTLAWVNCGHEEGWVADPEGGFERIGSASNPPLGTTTTKPVYEVSTRLLEPRDRLILVTDGITRRHVKGGGRFGERGVRRAVASASAPTAAATALAIQTAVTDSWTEPLEDDATLVVMAVD